MPSALKVRVLWTDQGQGDCVPSGSYREEPFAAHL